MGKYLKLYENDIDYQNYVKSDDYIMPNVSYARDTDIVYYNVVKETKLGVIMARYNASEENKLAIADTSNVKSLKVNGENVEFADTYYFSEVGEYDVEIELIDPTLINGLNLSGDMPKAMFWSMLNDIPTGAGLTSINIPDSVTTIEESAFLNCSSLTSVNIPDSVTTIGEYAFSGCINLTSVHIGSGVTSIGASVFSECTSLPVEDNLRYADTYLVEAVDKSLSTYTIKEGTKWIGGAAFYGCSGLTSINIPDSVTSIGYGAFNSCSGLTSINIPDSVTSIGINAFQSCSSLTSVNIPDSVTTIGIGAFAYCSGLTSINIPDSVTSINSSTFYGCSGLTSINIPDSVTSIKESAFSGCISLTSVEIGSGVTTIENGVFGGCSGLNKITCNAITAPTINSNTFRNVKLGGVLKVPTGSNYSSWMRTSKNYLGYYNWTVQEI